nr:DUF1127 domain-containing protein [uncultured Celeribacter sp.]
MTSLSLFRPRSARRAPSFFQRLFGLREIARQRRALANLSDEQLKDIGLSRADVEREAERPFWDAPQHWAR